MKKSYLALSAAAIASAAITPAFVHAEEELEASQKYDGVYDASAKRYYSMSEVKTLSRAAYEQLMNSYNAFFFKGGKFVPVHTGNASANSASDASGPVNESGSPYAFHQTPDSVKAPAPAPAPAPTPAPAPAGDYTLTILHNNDAHANTQELPKMIGAIKEARAKAKNSLTLFAGDQFSGTLYFNEFKGQSDLKLMNMAGYDAMVFGNHEFDLGATPEGQKALADFVRGASFPFVASNIDFSKDKDLAGLFQAKVSSAPEKGAIYTGLVKEVGGEKIGIFGLTTAETKNLSSPGAVSFSDYLEASEKMVAEFEKQGVNKIVALTHIGYDDNPKWDNDIELAKNVPGIDVIVGGHSHTELKEPKVLNADTKNPTVIVQAGQYNKFLGTLDVSFDKAGKIVSHKGALVDVSKATPDADAQKALSTYADQVKALETKAIGAAASAALPNPRATETSAASVRANETALGNVITDGMLRKARQYDKDVIAALQNGGGIRAELPAGDITTGSVIKVLPFGNVLATVKLTGAELLKALEVSVKEAPKENGGFLHVSGMRYSFDSSKPVGSRIVSAEFVDDAGKAVAVDPAKSYTIATNAFTAKGGDGYDMLAKAYAEGRVTDLGLSDWENLRDELVSRKSVADKVEGRIVDVAKQAAPAPK